MVRPALFALAALLVAGPGGAQDWREQYSPMPPRGHNANEARQSFPQLAAAARAAAGGGTLIGSDYSPQNESYRFKFINNGRVTWVDVDGRSGDVLNVEGR